MTYTAGKRSNRRKKKGWTAVIAIMAAVLIAVILFRPFSGRPSFGPGKTAAGGSRDIPAYSGQPFAVIHDNIPYFTKEDLRTEAFEQYSELDALGRCGAAFANVSRELMPEEERGEIWSIRPSGWNQEKYEGIVDSDPPYLYNRCHLIAYCLTAEDANEKNLITGTRYLNVSGMRPFEEQVAEYLDTHDHHVLYRVTPVFEGSNLLADGVLMEAYSVEDAGAGVCFCVFCYNVQPGIRIDYRTGASAAEK